MAGDHGAVSDTWDEVAELYGRGDSPLPELADRLVDRLAVGAGDRVLDIGCGNGLGLAALLARGVNAIVGVDFSDPMPRATRALIPEASPGSTSLVCGDVCSDRVAGSRCPDLWPSPRPSRRRS